MRLSILKTAVFFGLVGVFSGNVDARKDPEIPGTILSEEILNVTDTLSAGIVAVTDTHKVGFTTTVTAIGDSAIIWISFPSGFDISSLSGVFYSDNDNSNNGNEPSFSSFEIQGQTVKCFLASGNQPALAGSKISVELYDIINSMVSGDYSVSVFVSDSLENITHGPSVSGLFELAPDTLDHITFAPGSDTSLAAGLSIAFDVNGFDRYNNVINGLTFAYAVTVDSCGDVTDGVFTADKTGNCYVTATSGGITDSSGLITVVPGSFGSFSITGTPSSSTAGTPFIGPLTVTAYDTRGNIKSDYSGNIWFESNDTLADLPYVSGLPFFFPIDSSGISEFSGAGFTLKTAGSMFITVTDGVGSSDSDPVTVSATNISTFQLSAGSPQTAGQSFLLSVPFETARDQFGNLASGNIIISDSINAGSSPNGVPPLLSSIVVTNGSGSAFQTLTNASPHVVLKGSVAGSTVGTDTIAVSAGSISNFTMAGYPVSATAGDTLSGNITVTAFDAFGNLKINYADSVYFTSTDTNAVLHAGHRFTGPDSGSFVFAGGQFSFRSAGQQTITVTDGSVSETTESILVGPGIITDFSFSSPPFVMSGIPFVINVFNAYDQWGNLADGVISVSDSIGGGNSPNGTSPVFNSIQVVAGSGGANQTLVNADTTVLKGTVGSTVVLTDSIDVRPGDLGGLDLNISSPQYNDSAFTGTAELTSYDGYGNVKTDFDASVDTIVVTSSAGGVMQNNILNTSGDFISGVADLVVKQTSYSGRGGLMTFNAQSQSGRTAVSGPVEMRAIACEGIAIDQRTISWEDTATGSVDIANDGGVTVDITNIDILSETGLVFSPISVNPPLPASVGAGLQQTFNISFTIPNGAPVGDHPLTCSAIGLFGGVPVSDTLAGFPDTIMIQSASNVGYVAGSLSRDTLSSGRYYSLTLMISNTGGAGLALYDSSNIYFTDGSRQFRADISSGVFLPPGSPAGTHIILDTALVDPLFTQGTYQSVFNYFGDENGDFVSGSIILSDSITVERGFNLDYIAGSLSTDSVVLGQNVSFFIRLTNNGDASFELDHQNTYITFTDSIRDYIAYSDTSSSVRIDLINAGDTTLSFSPTILPPEFQTGDYLPTVTIRGIENGNAETIQFDTLPDSVTVLTRGALRIDSTYAMSRNAPFVNISQACSVKVAIANIGSEPVENAYILLQGESAPDSILIPVINGSSFTSAIFSFNAGATPDSGEILTASVTGGTGRISGDVAQVLQPLDNTTLLIIETPADISLSPLSVSWPPEAMDDTITVGQQISVSAYVTNFGMAGIEGVQRVTLDVGSSGFLLADSANREYSLDVPVAWDLTAPGNPSDSAGITVRFDMQPIDINDGSGAVGADSTSSRAFIINTNPTIFQSPAIIDPPGAVDGILSTDQAFVISDTVRAFGLYENLAASLTMPIGFSTEDPLIQTPLDSVVSWNVRAPASAVSDSFGLESWLFDPNTGDSNSTGADFIEITVVEKAKLNTSSSIIGPRAALDGILEPGALLQYEVVVHNMGEALAGEGVLSLHLGHPDMIAVESLVRPFNPDIPLVWNIIMPDSEALFPIPIWAKIDFVPFDENTNEPSFVINDSSSINVTIKELLPELVLELLDMHRGSVVNRQRVDFITFSLRNRDRGGSFSVGVSALKFTVAINPQTEINALFSDITLISDSSGTSPDYIANDTIGFVIENMLILEPGESREFTLRLDIAPEISVMDFVVSLNGEDISAVALEDGVPSAPLTAVSPRGEAEIISSDPTALLELTLSGSVSGYPNPFNPRTGPLKIGYFLEADSDLEIRIFTLLGEPVWTKTVSSSESLGRAGLHTDDSSLFWDGKNDTGNEVKSGVYICLVQNKTSGEEEKFKIAVVK